MLRTARLSLFAVLLLGLVTSCDFGAAGDAVDRFEVLVGLPSLASVVNVQAVDASDGSPISQEVQVTFDGQDESSVVDIYSDPLSEITVKGGFANFAVDSTRSPLSENPVRLTLRAQAEGFSATSVSVQITQEGSVNRVIRLSPENPEQSSEGTSGSRETVNTDDNGETTTAVTAQTGKTSSGSDAAEGSASIPAGTSLRTADGEPLQGQVTTDLSVFDNSSNAQELLPAEAKVTENGRRQIRGAVRFQAKDGDGRRASQYGGVEGGEATEIAADLPTLSTSSGTPSVTFVNPSTGASRTVELAASNSSQRLSAGKRAQEETTFQFIDGKVVVTTPSGKTDSIDMSQFEGEFFAAIGLEPSQRCAPQGTLDIGSNGQSGSLDVSVSGEGLSANTQVSIPRSQSPFTLSAADLFGVEMIPDVGSATVTLRAADEQEVSTQIDLCSESTSLDLPAPASDRISATVRVVPDCPQGERLPVSPPFDGYSVTYRQSGSTDQYQTVPKEDITINTTDDDLETVTSAVVPVSSVFPNTDYEFVGTFGEESSSQVVTMPGQDGNEVTVTDQELRDQCR
jgi:hypothetical protein